MGRKPRIHYPGAFYHCLNQAEVLELCSPHPAEKLLDLLSQTPGLSSLQVYQPERFPWLGSLPFQHQALRHQEPGRRLPRSFAGPKLPLKALAERISQAYRFPAEQLVGAHKGQHQRTELRRLLVYAASEYFFYPPTELALFFHCSPQAVTYLKASARQKIQACPALERELYELLTRKF
jgi:hypothetical protein